MSRPDNTKLTEARTMSKATSALFSSSGFSKREFTQFRTDIGTKRNTVLVVLSVPRTKLREMRDELKISSPSLCFDKLMVVLMTLRAFFEINRAMAMTKPERMR